MKKDNLEENRRHWDQEAATFDQEADHGLQDPLVRAAWHDLLVDSLPLAPASVLDIGCGTGSLSLLLAEMGYTVSGLDLSPAMLAQAQAKAESAGCSIPFYLGDAANPQIDTGPFAAIICRHMLWALPDPALALERWALLLDENGRLLLIEGYWHTGGGLHASQTIAAQPSAFAKVILKDLSNTSELWQKPVEDERYLVVAQK